MAFPMEKNAGIVTSRDTTSAIAFALGVAYCWCVVEAILIVQSRRVARRNRIARIRRTPLPAVREDVETFGVGLDDPC